MYKYSDYVIHPCEIEGLFTPIMEIDEEGKTWLTDFKKNCYSGL